MTISNSGALRQAPNAPTEGPERNQPSDVFDRLWRFFSSTKLALILILALAGLLLIAVTPFIAQTPGGLEPDEYASFLQRVRPRYGALTDVISALGLFQVAGSLWMRGLLGLLVVNTLVCTLNRWPRIWRTVFRPTVAASDSTFQSAANSREMVVERPVAEAVEAYRGVFARRGYRVLEAETDATYLYADRNRYSRLGTLVGHFAIIVVLLGAVVTSLFGLRNSQFAVPEGSTRAVGLGTGLAVKAEAFADEYYPEGPPKDYRSDLIVYDNGREVARQTIRVNEPLIYNGIRFHQSYFGPAIVMQVKDDSGKVLFGDGVALEYQMGNRPLGYLELLGTGLVAYVIGPASGTQGDPSLAAGQARLQVLGNGGQSLVGDAILTMGTPAKIGNLTYTFVRERQFTGLQVVRDPGAPIIWVGAGLMVMGMAAVLYFPHRRYWIRLRKAGDSTTRVDVVGVAGRDPGFGGEFEGLVEDLEGAADAGGAPDAATARRGT